jgi:hypothetical protein
LDEVVFLPSVEDMPEREWQRLASILARTAIVAESNAARELVELSGVSASS